MTGRKTHGYILTFRCINCGKYELFAHHPSDTVLHEEQVRERIYDVTCRSCGCQGGACGISATHISETNELCSSGRNRHASVVTR